MWWKCVAGSTSDRWCYIIFLLYNGIKDLGITLEPSLKFKSHIMDIIARAKQRAALIHRCFASRSVKNLTRAYSTYIRPMLEYATTVWSPSQITLINAIERVQKQFTKRLPGLKNLAYNERLKHSWPTKPRTSPTKIWPHFMLQYNSRPIRHPTW